jgi:F-type H+-transporting ATPase subunit b
VGVTRGGGHRHGGGDADRRAPDFAAAAVSVAVAAAADVLKAKMKADDANRLIDSAISEVGAKLH